MISTFYDIFFSIIIALPLLIIFYVVADFISRKFANKTKHSILLASLISILPTTIFPSAYAKRYSNGESTLGTLFASFLSSSNLVVLVLLMVPSYRIYGILLLIIKIIAGICLGHLTNVVIYKNLAKKYGNVDTFFSDLKKYQSTDESGSITDFENYQFDNKPDTLLDNSIKEDFDNTEQPITVDSQTNFENDNNAEFNKTNNETSKSKSFANQLKTATLKSLPIWAIYAVIIVALDLVFFNMTDLGISKLFPQSEFLKILMATFFGLIPCNILPVTFGLFFMAGFFTFPMLVGAVIANTGAGLLTLFITNRKNLSENLLVTAILTIYALSTAFLVFIISAII